MVRLNLAFKCYNNLLSSRAKIMTTRKYNFVSVLAIVAPVKLLISLTSVFAPGLASCVSLNVITQFSDYVKSKILHS